MKYIKEDLKIKTIWFDGTYSETIHAQITQARIFAYTPSELPVIYTAIHRAVIEELTRK